MASIISSDSGLVTGVPGLKTSADASGILQLQTGNNVTALTISSTGGVSFGASGTGYGTSGQVLQSNGDTVPTWVTPAGGSSVGSTLYLNSTFGGL